MQPSKEIHLSVKANQVLRKKNILIAFKPVLEIGPDTEMEMYLGEECFWEELAQEKNMVQRAQDSMKGLTYREAPHVVGLLYS